MSDFERLRDVGDDLERALLEAAFEPDDERAREERTLMALGLGVPAGSGADGAGGAAASSGGALVGKWLALVAAGGGVVALAVVGLQTERAPAPAPSASPPVSLAESPPPDIAPPPATAELQAPVAEPSAPRAMGRRPKAPASAASAPVDPSALTREIAALDRARTALRAGDPARARAELDRYDREFPFGALGPEARALRVRVDEKAEPVKK